MSANLCHVDFNSFNDFPLSCGVACHTFLTFIYRCLEQETFRERLEYFRGLLNGESEHDGEVAVRQFNEEQRELNAERIEAEPEVGAQGVVMNTNTQADEGRGEAAEQPEAKHCASGAAASCETRNAPVSPVRVTRK